MCIFIASQRLLIDVHFPYYGTEQVRICIFDGTLACMIAKLNAPSLPLVAHMRLMVQGTFRFWEICVLKE